jgi:hypothetical protein
MKVAAPRLQLMLALAQLIIQCVLQVLQSSEQSQNCTVTFGDGILACKSCSSWRRRADGSAAGDAALAAAPAGSWALLSAEMAEASAARR